MSAIKEYHIMPKWAGGEPEWCVYVWSGNLWENGAKNLSYECTIRKERHLKKAIAHLCKKPIVIKVEEEPS